jgi:hypothetical protein
MYYVVHKLDTLSQVAIHLGMHEHHVKEGINKESLDEIKLLVEGEVSHTRDAKNSTIAVVANKIFLAQHLFNEDVDGPM